ncbi:hypothetical protein DERF_013309 [Dermatophagoides farinae]|uniref:Uncharacterized protein n=1 Tax=Dermatophagoides farinae TaxID=6954 RepID=A0A922HQX8_DERFA|nr:hypothetical protein DERF_013309 [Dermatophagoides farinae]
MPLSRKNSPIAQPEYGAKYCNGAASEAVADTTTVINSDGGFTGLTIANNQLTLTTTDWYQRIDGFHTR